MGPDERALRARLGDGVGITRSEARAIGTVAGVLFDRLVDAGATEERDGRRVLKEYRPDPALMEQRRRDQEAMRERQRVLDEQRAARDKDSAARAEQEREQRILWANVGDYSAAEKPIVIAERAAALRESEAILNPTNKGA